MGVKRDYGSFAKASAKILAPQVAPLGFVPWYGNGFGRNREGWVEGFFLQQSQWGSGDFCINLGIHVPSLQEFWAEDNVKNVFGLLISYERSENGRTNNLRRWHKATNKAELESNLKIVASELAEADKWFHQFRSFTDVVAYYRKQSNLQIEPIANTSVIGAINYRLLLLLSRDKSEARRWLSVASEFLSRPTYWNPQTKTVSHDPAPGLKLLKPTKDDELRRRIIDSAMAKT